MWYIKWGVHLRWKSYPAAIFQGPRNNEPPSIWTEIRQYDCGGFENIVNNHFCNPGRDRAQRDRDGRGKIIGDQLFVRWELRLLYGQMHYPQIPVSAYTGFRYCGHIRGWKLTRFNFNEEKFIRCSRCLTEMRFTIRATPTGAEAATTVWANLGECRSPFGRQWQAVTEYCKPETFLSISRDEATYMKAFEEAGFIPPRWWLQGLFRVSSSVPQMGDMHCQYGYNGNQLPSWLWGREKVQCSNCCG